jgi:predicted transcriptional regulator
MKSESTTKEINLQLPNSLHYQLSQKAKERGVSLEALCLSLLEGSGLVDPTMYGALSTGQIRDEMTKVMSSNLPDSEIRVRVRQLEVQVRRRIR